MVKYRVYKHNNKVSANEIEVRFQYFVIYFNSLFQDMVPEDQSEDQIYNHKCDTFGCNGCRNA